MFTLEVRTETAEKKLELGAQAMSDLDVPLGRFGAYLRGKAMARYEAQDFPGLAPGTIEKRAQKGLRRLEGKLKQDLGKAMGRARKARGGRQGLLARVFTSSAVRHATEDAISSQTRGVQNRQAVLSQFQKWHRKGLKEAVGGRALTVKQRIGLLNREARAVGNAIGQPILGKLPRTVGYDVEDGVVRLHSRTHQIWSEAHNKGETVGHGATLPKRETILLEDSDLDVLISILKDAALIPFQEGLHGPGY